MMGNKKGILLTLVTIVLLVLMIAELITYVYLTINYETVSSFSSLSVGGYRLASTLNSGTASFLHVSLSAAISTIASYEGAGNRKGSYFVNSTPYALQSLMTNGMIYGTNEITLMGGSTLVNYTNAIIKQALFQDLNLSITNSSLQVYQTSPYYLNATYTALARISSSSGVFSYPISVGSSIALNGSPDLYSVQNNDNYVLRLTNKYAPATLVGNAYATSGSRSKFQFIYGTVIVENGIASCASIPAQFRNGNYILAIANDLALGSSCGFGGVVTYVPFSASAYTVPYLVYSSGSNVISYLNNGTSVLLSGQGLSLLNLSQLQSSAQAGYYSGSPYAPSYLDWSQNNITRRSQAGLFSLNLYRRLVPYFNPAISPYIIANDVFATTNSHVSISLWINPKSFISKFTGVGLANEGGDNAGNVLEVALTNSKILFGSPQAGCTSINSITVNAVIAPNTWHNIVAVFNTTGPNTIYLDGVSVGSGVLSLCNQRNNGFVIGAGSGGSFNGSIANLQTYNISLTPLQAATLYYEGVEGIAVTPRNLTGWWSLDGNAGDSSGKGNVGNVVSTVPNGISYQYLYNYPGDPVYGGSLSGNMTNLMEGAINCANLSQCSNTTLQHLYLGPTSLSAMNGIAQTEANTLGLANAVIPNVGSFNGNGYVFAKLNSYYGGNNQFSVSAWAYLNTTSTGPVFDIVGCAVPPGACGSTPMISISRNTIYGWLAGMNSNNPLSFTVNANTWHDIVVIYNGGTETLYVDGVSVGTGSGAYTPPGGVADYWANGCGTACTLTAGVANTLYGKMGDVQVYNTPLTAAQVSQLYLNDSAIGATPTDSWPLSFGWNSLINQSINTANTLNQAQFANWQGVCSNANVIENICGASFSQP